MDTFRFCVGLQSRHALRALIGISLVLSACGGGDGVTGGGTPPGAVDTCIVTEAGQTFEGSLPGGDPGARYLRGALEPIKGDVNIDSTGNFRYTPRTDFPGGDGRARGMDAFSYRLTDRNGRTTEAVVTVLIDGAVRIMPLGDSIVWGITTSGNPPLDERVGFRKPLRDALAQAGYRTRFVGTLESGTAEGFLPEDPRHEGHGAWKAAHLVDGNPMAPSGTGTGRLSEWLDQTQPDVVLLHIGTNDLNDAGDNTDRWTDIDRILDIIDEWARRHWPVTVIVARIINTHPTLFNERNSPERRAETTIYNNNVIDFVVTPRISNSDRVIWVDQEGQLARATDYASELHPSDAGYRKMADVWRYPLAGQGTPTGSHSGPGILPQCS